jgi:hypothetical protein
VFILSVEIYARIFGDLQMDNFRLFLCQKKDRQKTSVCTINKQTVKGLGKIAWAFHFPV